MGEIASLICHLCPSCLSPELSTYPSSSGFQHYAVVYTLHNWGDAWCSSKLVCFPSLPPMLLGWFESCLGFEFSGFSMYHFLKLVTRGFLWVLQFPSFLHRLIDSANNEAQINAISDMSDLVAELSLGTTWHTTCCT